jgi:hypothetical protein
MVCSPRHRWCGHVKAGETRRKTVQITLRWRACCLLLARRANGWRQSKPLNPKERRSAWRSCAAQRRHYEYFVSSRQAGTYPHRGQPRTSSASGTLRPSIGTGIAKDASSPQFHSVTCTLQQQIPRVKLSSHLLNPGQFRSRAEPLTGPAFEKWEGDIRRESSTRLGRTFPH